MLNLQSLVPLCRTMGQTQGPQKRRNLCSVMSVLSVTNLRAKPATIFSCVDASNWGYAHVKTDVKATDTLELSRHTIQKGAWSRLLSRTDRWMREHGILDEAHELPDQKLTQQRVWNTWLSVFSIVSSASRSYRTVNISICRRPAQSC